MTKDDSPVKKATTKHVIIIAMVNLHPIIPKAIRIAVILVAGADTKKASVAALEAPDLDRAIPVGITPQEHNGNGIPIKVAVRIERRFLCPRYLKTSSEGANAFSRPANRKPSNSQGAASFVNSHVQSRVLTTNLNNYIKSLYKTGRGRDLNPGHGISASFPSKICFKRKRGCHSPKG